MAKWRSNSSDDDDQELLRRAGGNWTGVRPSLDNPMTWSLKIMRIARIDVRVHVIMILFIIVRLARAAGSPAIGGSLSQFNVVAISIACLFIAVLLHEFGHCFACRRVGGDAHEILMWPLGGLAYCHPPHHWRAHFVTTIGGPFVNVILCLLCGSALGLATGVWWSVAIPNPFYPETGLLEITAHPWPLMVLFWFNWVNLILCLFNVVIPCFPMDGGRLVQAVLWSKFGYVRSMRLTVRIGYFGAIMLGLLGLFMEEYLLVLIAVFGGLTCFQTHKQLEWSSAELDFDDHAQPTDSRADSRRAAKRQKQEEDDARKLDAILKKIADSGMGSLNMRERRWLKRTSSRKKKGA